MKQLSLDKTGYSAVSAAERRWKKKLKSSKAA